jgi:uncharacterized beta-barrel protein YwiB (DUF1934 family)
MQTGLLTHVFTQNHDKFETHYESHYYERGPLHALRFIEKDTQIKTILTWKNEHTLKLQRYATHTNMFEFNEQREYRMDYVMETGVIVMTIKTLHLRIKQTKKMIKIHCDYVLLQDGESLGTFSHVFQFLVDEKSSTSS